MDEVEFNNAVFPVFRHLVLREARLLFGAFYGVATANDENLMDTLVMAYTTLTRGMNIPRDLVAAGERNELEHPVTSWNGASCWLATACEVRRRSRNS